MEQQKAQGVPDMTHEFDPIDPRQVMQQMVHSVDVPHTDGPPTHAEPDGDEGPLPHEMPHGAKADGSDQEVHVHGDDSEVHVHDDDSDNDGPFPKGDKQKAKEKAEKKDKSDKKDGPKKSPKDEAKEAAFRERRLRKFAGVLEDQYRQAEIAFDDTFVALKQRFKLAHGAPSMEAFEKDALALHGDEVGVAMLNAVRIDLGYAPLESDVIHTKTASLADRHLVEENETTRLFERLVKIATEATKLQHGAEHVRLMCS
jgi:hypothetical protein